jgi:hypothetical protein
MFKSRNAAVGMLGRVIGGNGRGNFFRQYHYWPRDLNRETRRERQETERTPVQLENRITGCKLTSSYLNTKLCVENWN